MLCVLHGAVCAREIPTAKVRGGRAGRRKVAKSASSYLAEKYFTLNYLFGSLFGHFGFHIGFSFFAVSIPKNERHDCRTENKQDSSVCAA